jgi:hypothetical protein
MAGMVVADTVATTAATMAAVDTVVADTAAVSVPVKDRRLIQCRARGSRSRMARACAVLESRYRRMSAYAAFASKLDHSIANPE